MERAFVKVVDPPFHRFQASKFQNHNSENSKTQPSNPNQSGVDQKFVKESPPKPPNPLLKPSVRKVSFSSPSMASEDFTFPATTESFHSAIDSPPLWLLSPSNSPDSPGFGFRDRKRGRKGGEDFSPAKPSRSISYSQRKSFSCAEMAVTVREDHGEKEEKMDMLWEDFNEDLRRSRSLKLSTVKSFDDGMVQIDCVRELRRPKTSSAVIPTKKTSVVAIVKVFRKLFLLRNSRQKLKTHPW